jgi:CheY-like chemotaxis protein
MDKVANTGLAFDILAGSGYTFVEEVTWPSLLTLTLPILSPLPSSRSVTLPPDRDGLVWSETFRRRGTGFSLHRSSLSVATDIITITLPIQQKTIEKEGHSVKSKDTQPTAIIVQPEEAMAAVFEHLLRQAGFATEVFADGSDVLHRLAGPVADVVIIELYLPTVTGLDILSRMQDDERWATSHIVAVTASERLAQIAQEDALAHQVLLHPCATSRLVADLAQRFIDS